jgi:hypothetical protein
MSTEAQREVGELLIEQLPPDECENRRCVQIASTASDVYCDVTGGLLSYPTYDARTVIQHAEAYTQNLIDAEVQRATDYLARQLAIVTDERDAALLRAEKAERGCYRCGGTA